MLFLAIFCIEIRSINVSPMINMCKKQQSTYLRSIFLDESSETSERVAAIRGSRGFEETYTRRARPRGEGLKKKQKTLEWRSESGILDNAARRRSHTRSRSRRRHCRSTSRSDKDRWLEDCLQIEERRRASSAKEETGLAAELRPSILASGRPQPTGLKNQPTRRDVAAKVAAFALSQRSTRLRGPIRWFHTLSTAHRATGSGSQGKIIVFVSLFNWQQSMLEVHS